MTLAKYIDRYCEIQERLSDYSIATLLSCEADITYIMQDAIVDSSLTEPELDELWERRENLLLEIESKYNSLRG